MEQALEKIFQKYLKDLNEVRRARGTAKVKPFLRALMRAAAVFAVAELILEEEG